MTAALKQKNYEEFLLAACQSQNSEFIDGQIVQKALPSGRHADVMSCVITQIASKFRRKLRSDGSGGWWILADVSIRYHQLERVLQPDVAGWRRERTPLCPSEFPVQIRPDWVCEVSHTTRKKDSTIVPETLSAEAVPYYWLLDVEAENLQVFELVENKKYALIQSLFRDDGEVAIAPFQTVKLNVGTLFGDDAN